MRTRSEARREDEAAAAVVGAAAPAARHAALLALLPGPPHVLEAALAALGLPGSTSVLEALAYDGYALLRAACSLEQLDAIAPLVRAYGESPHACADVLRALYESNEQATALAAACHAGHVIAVEALLGAYRRAGRAHEALAYGDHAALRYSTGHADTVALLLAEYGEPGCVAVLAALAAGGHCALRYACGVPCARSVALLAAAYGPPGCKAAHKAWKSKEFGYYFKGMFNNWKVAHSDRILAELDAILAVLLAALGEPDNAAALHVLGA